MTNRVKDLEQVLKDVLGCWKYDGVSDQHETIYLGGKRILEESYVDDTVEAGTGTDADVVLVNNVSNEVDNSGFQPSLRGTSPEGHPVLEEEWIVTETINGIMKQNIYRKVYKTDD